MDEIVEVCLVEPPVCLSLPAKFALVGVSLFIIWKIVDCATSYEKTDKPMKDQSQNRKIVRR